ncbi:MAG: AbgT family transporter [Propionibacterium sp.]|nr:AbgT family transporter [Propionibacterium sp.]
MSEHTATEQPEKKQKKRKGLLTRFLDMIEWTGNKLPDPIMIFVGLCALILVASAIASAAGAQATHPATGEVIEAVNLLNGENIGRIFSEAARNFGTFPALGMVLVVMLGIGLAERSGWFEVMLQSAVTKAPKVLIIPAIAFIGLLGNVAGDAAPIVLPPLAAMIFIKMGWHPIAGIALAYAASVGGFAANFILGMSDALVQVFTQPAAELIDPDIQTNVAMNWYFIAASVVILLPIIWVITSRVTVPRLGTYDNPEMGSEIIAIEPQQRKGLLWANISVGIVTLLLVVLVIPENSFLRNAETGSIVNDSPLMNGVGLVLAIWFFIPGLVYGLVAGTIKGSADISRMMVESMGSMANFIVIVFFAAQMLAYFGWSNLGTIIAIKGAELLEGQSGIVIIIGIILISSFINLFIGSASAKWAILAPIFVPMMMLLGYHPAFTQMIYRIGDGITNPITPMFPYFALVLSYAQRYDKKIGIGTFISALVPYSLAMGIGWTLLMIVWYLLGWPVGPGGPIYLN